MMELILISDSKLKIMLTRDDMQQYALDCDTIDYDNTETRGPSGTFSTKQSTVPVLTRQPSGCLSSSIRRRRGAVRCM